MGNYLKVYTTMGIYYGPYGSFSVRVGGCDIFALLFKIKIKSNQPLMLTYRHYRALASASRFQEAELVIIACGLTPVAHQDGGLRK